MIHHAGSINWGGREGGREGGINKRCSSHKERLRLNYNSNNENHILRTVAQTAD